MRRFPMTSAAVVKAQPQGCEIATTGGASVGSHIVLQRGTSACLCHSAPRQACEEMN